MKALALAVFFGGDHLVWADGAGLLGSKEAKEWAAAAGRLSLRGWCLASLCQLAADLAELRNMHAARAARAAGPAGAEAKAPSREALALRWASASAAAGQAVVSAGLAGLVPLPPRTIGLFGVATSVVQLYALLPALPVAKGGKAA